MAVVAAGMLAVHGAISPAPLAASDGQPTGGLYFALQPGLSLDETEIAVSPESIRLTYRVSNSGRAPRTALVTFPLPEIDRFSFADAGGFAALRDPVNIVGATTTVDGQSITLLAQQRAYALGLDVTAALSQAGLPLLPIQPDIDQRVSRLAPDLLADLVERGVLQYEEGKPRPGWVLQTVGHWRQALAATSTTVIQHTYTPLVGIQPLSERSIMQASERACLPPVVADSLRARLGQPSPPTVTTVLVQHTGAQGLESADKMRIRIVVPEGVVAVATCLEPLTRPDARTIEWSAQPSPYEQEIVVAFVR